MSLRGKQPPPDRRRVRSELRAIGELLTEMGVEATRHDLATLTVRWSAAVGKLANHSRVIGYASAKRELRVAVSSSVWLNELTFLKAELIAALNKAGVDVASLMLVIDRRRGGSPARRVRVEVEPDQPRPRAAGAARIAALVQSVPQDDVRAALRDLLDAASRRNRDT